MLKPLRPDGSLSSLDRLPPQDIEAEQSVIGAILLENEVLPEIKGFLSPEDFYKDAHKKIYAAMLSLHEKNEPIDLITLTECMSGKNELESVGGAAYFSAIVNQVPTSANIKHHAKIVKEKADLRRLIIFGTEAIKIGYEDEVGGSEIALAKAQMLFMEVVGKAGGGEEIEDAGGKLSDLQSYLSLRETPFKTLNTEIGGFSGGRIILIGGRPGMGKTAFALDLLRHTCFAEGLPVAYFGARINREDIRLKLLSAMCDIDHRDIRRGRLPEELINKLETANKKLSEQALFVLDTTEKKMNVAVVASKLRKKIKEKGKFGSIVIENIQDLVWDSVSKDIEQMDKVSNVLISLAHELGTPLILSSQIKQDVLTREDKRPQVGDMRLGLKFEDAAGVIILLHRPDYYKPKVKGAEPHLNFEEAEIIIGKGGSPIILPHKFYGGFCSWREE